MATPPKPWKAEYAKSGRSSCKTCKNPIDKDKPRLGKMVVATQFDGFMPMWNHLNCILKKKNQIKLIDDIDGFDLLRWDDQQKIRGYVEGAVADTTVSLAPAASECSIEVSQTSRATCKICSEKIIKGNVRVSAKPEGKNNKAVSWNHVNCFMKVSPTDELEKFSGWDALADPERKNVKAMLKQQVLASNDAQQRDDDKVAASSSSRGTKRKKIADSGQSAEFSKNGGTHLVGLAAERDSEALVIRQDDAKLMEQNKALWAIKDDLQKNVKPSELREMLEVNEQDATGSEYDLRERCADGMLFGALSKCPICSGSLHYSGGMYKCLGYLSAWSKCSYSTAEPNRVKGKWEIPEDSDNEYLAKWFKAQKIKKPVRVLPAQTASQSLATAVQGFPQSNISGRLDELRVAVAGELVESSELWRTKVEEVGGVFHPKLKKGTTCLLVKGDTDVDDPDVKKARRMKVPVVREDYLVDCIKEKKRLPTNLYQVEAFIDGKIGKVTVKVKGHSAVNEFSGLQDSGHILEEGKSIYNTTLNMSDLTTGINSYYILQVIQEDKGKECYVFRKWGRVGNEKIGGSKLEEMSKSDAIHEFKRLFLEKTGNTYEAWEKKENFVKQPGKFFPLDIDYGIKHLPRMVPHSDVKTQLAPRLVDLMKMLFNVETYRAAMLEFEINMSEMPLGKLSKRNIQKGFEVLTEIQNLMVNGIYDPKIKESLIVDASNRFFTVIPSIHPHIIRNEDDFKSKVKMLEALQDIEIASRLVGFDSNDDDPLDEKYKKLHCGISPLPHDSADYQLVKKYLLNTHAPTHKDWTLELEDVFTLEREGEVDKFAPYREKLKNRMLLWHGSRVTNFVGILNQGLRIAPPEAPTTGYMFGKGIYFADLVSKSAQYCFTDRKDPVGLMLLSEVALGEIHQLKKATYMESPPKGKHSTKGLGKTVPLEAEFQKWRNEVVVPCGKPVSSSIRASELMYNEYIVYNTSQVKMQFLLKVRFHYKR